MLKQGSYASLPDTPSVDTIIVCQRLSIDGKLKTVAVTIDGIVTPDIIECYGWAVRRSSGLSVFFFWG